MEAENTIVFVVLHTNTKHPQIAVDDYTFNYNRTNIDSFYYKCCKSTSHDCPASLTIKNDFKKIISTKGLHNHDSMPQTVKEKTFYGKVHEKVQKNPTCEPQHYYAQTLQDSVQHFAETYKADHGEEESEEELAEFANQFLKGLPSKEKVLKNISYNKSKNFPSNPHSLEDIQLQETELEKTHFGSKFLLFDSQDTDRIIIFGTQEKLLYFANTQHIFMDGTFATSSDLFYQLFTIQGKVLKTIIPLLYVFLVSKTKDIYKKMFEIIKELCVQKGYSWKPSLITTDFESGLIAAIGDSFDPAETIHKGCYFHYCQALRNYFQKCELDKSAWKQNPFHWRFYCAFKYMAFLPQVELDSAFNQLRAKYIEKVPSESVEKWMLFCHYYENTWLQNRRHRRMFTYFNEPIPRTNNNTERWNRQFKEHVGNRKGIYSVIQALKLDDILASKKLLDSSVIVVPKQDKSDLAKFNDIVETLQSAFSRNEGMTALQFLESLLDNKFELV